MGLPTTHNDTSGASPAREGMSELVAKNMIENQGKKIVPKAPFMALEMPFPFSVTTPAGEIKGNSGDVLILTSDGSILTETKEVVDSGYKPARTSRPKNESV